MDSYKLYKIYIAEKIIASKNISIALIEFEIIGCVLEFTCYVGNFVIVILVLI